MMRCRCMRDKDTRHSIMPDLVEIVLGYRTWMVVECGKDRENTQVR
jgi:hypothetical protein